MGQPLTIALANSGRKWIGEIAHVAMLYDQYEALGHRPWIICRRGFALEAYARERSLRHLSLTFNGSFNPLADGRDAAQWLAWARAERPDVIHCHRGKDHWLGCYVAARCRRPLIRTRHVVMPIHRHLMNRWLYFRATGAVICVSQAARQTFGPWADRLPNCRVVLSAVDSDKFNPGLRSDTWRREIAGLGASGAGEPLWYGLVGRFQSIKGQKYYLEAAARVAREFPEARFLIAGAGSDGQAQKYRAQAAELGIADKIHIVGYLPNLPEVLASLDVGVIASVGSEGSSRIAMEMMASGVPLAATRVGGIPDIAEHSGAARLVAPRDPEALAEAMLAWAKDPEARGAAGLAGRRHVVEHHHPRRWAEAMLEAYRSAPLFPNPAK